MPYFEIPESVKAYFQDRPTRNVVDSLVSTLDDPVLPDMDRIKLIDLSEGVLLTCQIRADFVRFMAGLWGNTFGAALAGSGLNEIFPEDCTIKEVWTEKYFWSYVTKGTDFEHTHFDLTVQIEQRSDKVILRVLRYDAKGKQQGFGPDLQVPNGWRRVDIDGDPEIAMTEVTMADLIANPAEKLDDLRHAAANVLPFIARLN